MKLRHADWSLRKFYWISKFYDLNGAATQPGGVLTRPATQAHVDRPERRLARSRAHEAEQRDVEVRFSLDEPLLPASSLTRNTRNTPYAPVFPSWDWASRPFIHVRRLCLWNTPVRMRDM